MNDRRLDEAIDRVAAGLVAASPDDDRVLRQVVARLPERVPAPWFMTMPIQLVGAAALVLVAFVYARPARQLAPIESPAVATMTPVAPPIPDPRSLIPDPRSPIPAVIARRGNAGRGPALIDRPDHEFSLPPVDAVTAIELSTITTPAFAPAALEALAPLVLTDLPLASDSSSTHER